MSDSTMSILGTYSGIDLDTIDQLMEIERAPIDSLETKNETLAEEDTAWQTINTKLYSFSNILKDMQYESLYSTKTVSATDEDAISGTASANALTGTYSISVERLATTTRIIGGQVNLDTTAELGYAGTFTIENADGDTFDVTVEATDTLASVVSKINDDANETGIEAKIVDGRILLDETEYGARDITLTSSDTILDDLMLSAGNTFSETTGQTAQLTVDGISIERDTNTITDVIENVTLKLTDTTTGTETLTIGSDTEKLTDKLQEFVDTYNEIYEYITTAYDYDAVHYGDDDATDDSPYDLSGDSTLTRLISGMRSNLFNNITNDNTTFTDLSELGITTTGQDGLLEFDTDVFLEAFEEDPDNVQNFFLSENESGEKIGFVEEYSDYIELYSSKSTGLIKTKITSIESEIEDNEEKIEAYEVKMELKRQRYIDIYTALDVALLEMENTMSSLESALSGLSTYSSSSSE
jgi:flagellar hook-associated protein 2